MVTGTSLLSNKFLELTEGRSLNTHKMLGNLALSQGMGGLGTIRAGRDLRGLIDDSLGELGQERGSSYPVTPLASNPLSFIPMGGTLLSPPSPEAQSSPGKPPGKT